MLLTLHAMPADLQAKSPPKTDCGDNILSDAELCDGNNIGGLNCASLGFESGVLQCTDDCLYDTSGCVGVGAVCGDGR